MSGFVNLDYETLSYLESMNLTYSEMIPYFAIKVNVNYLSRKFKRLGIRHKTLIEILYDKVKASNLSIEGMCIKYKCSKKTICRIKKKIREDENDNNNNTE